MIEGEKAEQTQRGFLQATSVNKGLKLLDKLNPKFYHCLIRANCDNPVDAVVTGIHAI